MADNITEEEEERVTAQSYGALDISQVADECWLIRIPQKLAEVWETVPEGTDLGELIFTKGGTENNKSIKPSLNVCVADEIANYTESALPLNYSLQAMTKKIPTMHPFTRNPNTGSIKLLGTVTRTANMQVEQDNNYRALLKDRLVKSNLSNSRYVKPVETVESVMNKQPIDTREKAFGSAVYKFGQKMIEAQQEYQMNASQQHDTQGPAKKARQFAPDQPIRSVLFELFSTQQYWTVKDLKTAAVAGGATSAGTKKGEAEIRDILREIGDYHRSGDHKNMWELRKEFQQS